MKGAVATGVAATGLGMFGSATAQQSVRNLNVQLSDSDGLVVVDVSNTNVLNNVEVEDVAVTVIGDDVDVDIEDLLNDLDVDVDVDDVVNDIDLDVDDVQVAVAVLGESDIVGAGSDALDL